ncbi:hypothetical protein L2E82_17389 [Cichorium intybus]|uniref:Uncharacterized protein n=1 Tax=Cichorium intybus TaxID=13427 RepID=A0ACB9F7R2_CICIN|nr:hypothetical protein L2E82_17389 [Cichorium intybus]
MYVSGFFISCFLFSFDHILNLFSFLNFMHKNIYMTIHLFNLHLSFRSFVRVYSVDFPSIAPSVTSISRATPTTPYPPITLHFVDFASLYHSTASLLGFFCRKDLNN